MSSEAELRRVALALPEAVEVETWGHPTFRVRTKMFATCGTGDHGRPTATMKAPPGEQQALVASDPDTFFVPAYVGTKGWIGVRLDRVDTGELAELVEESYRMTAPKRLVRLLDG